MPASADAHWRWWLLGWVAALLLPTDAQQSPVVAWGLRNNGPQSPTSVGMTIHVEFEWATAGAGTVQDYGFLVSEGAGCSSPTTQRMVSPVDLGTSIVFNATLTGVAGSPGPFTVCYHEDRTGNNHEVPNTLTVTDSSAVLQPEAVWRAGQLDASIGIRGVAGIDALRAVPCSGGTCGTFPTQAQLCAAQSPNEIVLRRTSGQFAVDVPLNTPLGEYRVCFAIGDWWGEVRQRLRVTKLNPSGFRITTGANTVRRGDNVTIEIAVDGAEPITSIQLFREAGAMCGGSDILTVPEPSTWVVLQDPSIEGQDVELCVELGGNSSRVPLSSPPGRLTVTAAHPQSYTPFPDTPLAHRKVTITFTPAAGLSLSASDVVSIRDNDCSAPVDSEMVNYRTPLRVSGTGTQLDIIFSTSVQTMSYQLCYQPSGHPWTSVMDSLLEVGVASPIECSASPVAERVEDIIFPAGANIPPDTFRLALPSSNCSDENWIAESAYRVTSREANILAVTVTLPGCFRVCVRDETEWAWVWNRGNSSDCPGLLHVREATPKTVTRDPAAVRAGQTVEYRFTPPDDNRVLSSSDSFYIVAAGSGNAEHCNGVPVARGTVNREGNGSTFGYAKIPQSGTFVVCYQLQQRGVAPVGDGSGGYTFTVSAPSPTLDKMVPPSPRVGQSFNITLSGSGATAVIQVFKDLVQCSASSTCHCPPKEDPGDVGARVGNTPTWRLPAVQEQNRLAVCHRECVTCPPTLIILVAVAPRHPREVVVSPTPRQGMSFVLTFQPQPDEHPLTDFDTVDILRRPTRSVCPCGTTECATAFSGTVTLQGDGKTTITVPPTLSHTDFYTVCYLPVNPDASYSHIPVRSGTNTSQLLVISPPNPNSVTLVPVDPRVSELVNITFSGTDLGPGDEFRVSVASCTANESADIRRYGTLSTVSGSASATVVAMARATYRLCYRFRTETHFSEVGTMRVVASVPSSITVNPPVPSEDAQVVLTAVNCTACTTTGTTCADRDRVVMVPSSSAGFCGGWPRAGYPWSTHPVGTMAWNDTQATYIGCVGSGSRVVIPTTTKPGTYTVCYRPTGRPQFTMFGSVVIKPPNPSHITVTPPKPYSGQLAVTVDFHGEGLTTDDRALLVVSGTPCHTYNTRSPAVVGSLSGDSSVIRWHLNRTSVYDAVIDKPSTAEPHAALDVVACYRRVGHFWATVMGFQIEGANPQSVSVTPEDGGAVAFNRTITLAFTGRDLSDADEVRIVDAGSSCLDGGSTSESVVLIGQREVPATCVTCRLTQRVRVRVRSGHFTVCYRLRGRTFSSIGGFRVLSAITSPQFLDVLPLPDGWAVGEPFTLRFRYSPTGNHSYNGFTPQDTVHLVRRGRECIDTDRVHFGAFSVTNWTATVPSPGAYTVCVSLAAFGGAEQMLPRDLVIVAARPSHFIPSMPFAGAVRLRFFNIDANPGDVMVLATGECGSGTVLSTTTNATAREVEATTPVDTPPGEYTVCYRRENRTFAVTKQGAVPLHLVAWKGGGWSSEGQVPLSLQQTGYQPQEGTAFPTSYLAFASSPSVITAPSAPLPFRTNLTVAAWVRIGSHTPFTMASIGGVSVGVAADGTMLVDGRAAVPPVGIPTGAWVLAAWHWQLTGVFVTEVLGSSPQRESGSGAPLPTFPTALPARFADGFRGDLHLIAVYAGLVDLSETAEVTAMATPQPTRLRLVAKTPQQYAVSPADHIRDRVPAVLSFTGGSESLTAGDRVAVVPDGSPCPALRDDGVLVTNTTGNESQYSLVLAQGSWSVCYRPLRGMWTAIPPTLTVLPTSPTSVAGPSEVMERQRVILAFTESAGDSLHPDDLVGLGLGTSCATPLTPVVRKANTTSVLLRAPGEGVYTVCYARGAAAHPLRGVWHPIPAYQLRVNPLSVTATPPAVLFDGLNGTNLAIAPAPSTGHRLALLPLTLPDTPATDPCMTTDPTSSSSVAEALNPITPLAAGTYTTCYYDGTRWGSLKEVISVAPRNPTGYTANPPAPHRSGQTVTISLTLSTDPAALPTDGLLTVVTHGEPCTPSAMNTTTTSITLKPAAGLYDVCYSPAPGGFLRLSPRFEVDPPNPHLYETLPLGPVANSPFDITFRGSGLTTSDAAKLVPSPAGCDDTGTALTLVTAMGTRATTSVAAGMYTVCYRITGTAGWGAVPPGILEVFPSNPFAYSVAGVAQPYQNDPVVFSFSGHHLGPGDSAAIVPSASACGSSGGRSVLSGVCFSPADVGSYSVCYKLNGSPEWSRVGGLFTVSQAAVEVVSVVPRSPRVSEEVVLTLSTPANVTVLLVDSPPSCAHPVGPVELWGISQRNTTHMVVRTSFPSEATHYLAIPNATLPMGSSPASLVVAPRAPTAFSPTVVSVGHQVVFAFIAPDEGADVQIGGDCGGSAMVTARRYAAVQVPNATGDHTVCYRRDGGGWVRLDQKLSITPSPFTSASSCPSPAIRRQFLTVDVPSATALRLTPTANCTDFIAEGATPLTFTLPDGPSTSLGVCARDTVGAAWTYLTVAIGPNGTITVQQPVPLTIATQPAELRVGQAGAVVTFIGSNLSANDVVTVLPVPSTCNETCADTVPPSSGGVSSVSALKGRYEVVNQEGRFALDVLNVTGEYVVCYRRRSAPLVRVDEVLVVQERVPSQWDLNVSEVHGGEAVAFTFTPSVPNERLALVDGSCYTTTPTAGPVAVKTDFTPSSRTLRVCHHSPGVGWVEVPPAFTLLPSVPDTVSITASREGITTQVAVLTPTTSDDLLGVAPVGSPCTPTGPLRQTLQLREGEYAMCYHRKGGTPVPIYNHSTGNITTFTVLAPLPASHTPASPPQRGRRFTTELTPPITSPDNTTAFLASPQCNGTVLARWTPSATTLSTFLSPTAPSTAYLCFNDSMGVRTVPPFAATPLSLLTPNPSAARFAPSPARVAVFNTYIVLSSTLPSADSVYAVPSGPRTDPHRSVCETATPVFTTANVTRNSTALTVGPVMFNTTRSLTGCVSSLGSVYEAPGVLQVLPRDPTGFTAVPSAPRVGYDTNITFIGTTLDVATDTIAVAIEGCNGRTAATVLSWGGSPPVALVGFPAQGEYLVCYRTGVGGWSVLPDRITVTPPNPSAVTISPSTVYAGHPITLDFIGDGLTTSDTVRVANGTTCLSTPLTEGPPSDVPSPTNSLFRLDQGISLGGSYPVCYRLSSEQMWTHVGDITVLPPNPSHFTTFPSPPRVGQSVVLTVHGDNLDSSDTVFLVPFGDSCGATRVEEGSGSTWKIGARYSSFAAPATYTVCYRLTPFSIAIPIGASVASSRLEVEGALPTAMTVEGVAGGPPYIGEPFTVTFLGNVPPGGEMKFISAGAECDAPPLMTTSFTGVPRVTLWLNGPLGGVTRGVCFRLPNATYAPYPNITVLPQSFVPCATVPTSREGQIAPVLLRNTTALPEPSELRVVPWEDHPNCHTAPSPLEIVRRSPTEYGVPIPHGSPNAALRLCFRDPHRLLWVPVCAGCGASSNCSIPVLPARPASYTTTPSTPFVGELITLTINEPGVGSAWLVRGTGGCGTPTYNMTSGSVASYEVRVPPFDRSGSFAVCHQYAGDPVPTALAVPLVVSPFAMCSILPEAMTGRNVTPEVARQTEVTATPPPRVDPPFATINTTGGVLGLSTDTACTAVGGGSSPLRVVFDAAPRYVCYRRVGGTWAVLCRVDPLPSSVAGCTIVPQRPVARQYVTVAFNTSSSSGSYTATAGECHEGGLQWGAVANATTDPRAFAAGVYNLCYRDRAVAPQFATRACELTVERATPERVDIRGACRNVETDIRPVAIFTPNHPLGYTPSAADEAGVVVPPATCLTPTLVAPVALTSSALEVITGPFRFTTPGEKTLCYRLNGTAWGTVQNFTVEPHNPHSVSVVPDPPRGGQLLSITFHGTDLDPVTDEASYSLSTCTAGSSRATVTGGNSTAVVVSAVLPPGKVALCYSRGVCSPASIGFTVLPYHPSRCSAPQTVEAGFNATITFGTSEGPLSNTDTVKLVPSPEGCSAPPGSGTTELSPRLLNSSGAVVQVVFFSADTFAPPAPITYRVCYSLAGEPFAQVGGSCAVTVLPRNPSSFETVPTTPSTRRPFQVIFHGTGFTQVDRAVLVPTASCPTTATAGERIEWVNGNLTRVTVLIPSPGEYTVCYYRQMRWVRLVQRIPLAPSNPSHYEVRPLKPPTVPNPLGGVTFSLYFFRGGNGTTSHPLGSGDTVHIDLLHGGETHTFPTTLVLDGGNVTVFEMAMNAGNYTVRYVPHNDEPLHFDDLAVHRNPYAYESLPAVPRVNQRVTLLFRGASLNPGGGDAFGLVPTGTQCSNDTVNTSAALTSLTSAPNGEARVDVMLHTSDKHTVCYRRKGSPGWLSLGPPVSPMDSNPSHWNSSKTVPVVIGEGLPINIHFCEGCPAWQHGDGAYVVPAGVRCGDRPLPNVTVLTPSTDHPAVPLKLRIRDPAVYRLCYRRDEGDGVYSWVPPLIDVTLPPPTHPIQVSAPSTARAGGSLVNLQLTFRSASRTALLQGTTFRLAFPRGTDGELCTGNVSTPWARSVTPDTVTFTGKEGGPVTVCLVPDSCTTCTRLVGSFLLKGRGTDGFDLANNATVGPGEVWVYGEDVGVGDELVLARPGSNCFDPTPSPSSSVLRGPVLEGGISRAVYHVDWGVDPVVMCYRLSGDPTPSILPRLGTGNHTVVPRFTTSLTCALVGGALVITFDVPPLQGATLTVSSPTLPSFPNATWSPSRSTATVPLPSSPPPGSHDITATLGNLSSPCPPLVVTPPPPPPATSAPSPPPNPPPPPPPSPPPSPPPPPPASPPPSPPPPPPTPVTIQQLLLATSPQTFNKDAFLPALASALEVDPAALQILRLCSVTVSNGRTEVVRSSCTLGSTLPPPADGTAVELRMAASNDAVARLDHIAQQSYLGNPPSGLEGFPFLSPTLVWPAPAATDAPETKAPTPVPTWGTIGTTANDDDCSGGVCLGHIILIVVGFFLGLLILAMIAAVRMNQSKPNPTVVCSPTPATVVFSDPEKDLRIQTLQHEKAELAYKTSELESQIRSIRADTTHIPTMGTPNTRSFLRSPVLSAKDNAAPPLPPIPPSTNLGLGRAAHPKESPKSPSPSPSPSPLPAPAYQQTSPAAPLLPTQPTPTEPVKKAAAPAPFEPKPTTASNSGNTGKYHKKESTPASRPLAAGGRPWHLEGHTPPESVDNSDFVEQPEGSHWSHIRGSPPRNR